MYFERYLRSIHTLIQPKNDLPKGKKGPSQVKMNLTMSLMSARSVLLSGL